MTDCKTAWIKKKNVVICYVTKISDKNLIPVSQTYQNKLL